MMKPYVHLQRSYHSFALRRIVPAVLLLSLLLLAGCSGSSGNSGNTAEWDLADLSNRLSTEITYTDTLSEMDDSLMDYLYPDIDSADVSEKIIYISSGSTAEEIAAFQAVDEKAAERIEEGLKKRIEQQTESFTDYVPEEVKRLEDAVLVRNGSYVILSVSGDPDKAKDILKK